MHVELISANVHSSAFARMDDLMAFGTDELALAVCYCTNLGVKLLGKHHRSLTRSSSCFAVVAAEPINDFSGLDELNQQKLAGHLYLHGGFTGPWERGLKTPLMHSKLVYARKGDQCQLWVGSHNFTSHGLNENIEAAALIAGCSDETVFADARRHLNAIRAEAELFTVPPEPPPAPEKFDLLTIHAECANALPSAPTAAAPIFVALALNTSAYDRILTGTPPARLFLYQPGSLRNGGWRHATPFAAYSGQLTGTNYTRRNSRAPGTDADWSQARAFIDNADPVPVLRHSLSPQHKAGVETQSMLTFHSLLQDPNRVYLEGAGKLLSEDVPGRTFTIEGPLQFEAADEFPGLIGLDDLDDEFIVLPGAVTLRAGELIGRVVEDPFLRPHEVARLNAWFRDHRWTLRTPEDRLGQRTLDSDDSLAPFIRRTSHFYSPR